MTSPAHSSRGGSTWVAQFYPHWVAATGVAMVLLLAYAPLLLAGRSAGIAAIYLATPAYMLHQIEEHRGDRFRAYVNRRQFGGYPALTEGITLWVNLAGVWGINFAALWTALRWGEGWGLVAIDLMLVNGVVHGLGALRWREYHPGVGTGLALFIPYGIIAPRLIPATTGQQWLGLGLAVALHLALLGIVGLRVWRGRRVC